MEGRNWLAEAEAETFREAASHAPIRAEKRPPRLQIPPKRRRFARLYLEFRPVPRKFRFSVKSDVMRRKALRFFELALVLVPLDHIASRIVNAAPAY